MSEYTILFNLLTEYVNNHSKNGIVQHSEKWLAEKVFTIGGSSLATIQNLNPFSSIAKLISEKIGLTSFNGDIKPQWGNLFEDVIKRYVEYDRNCIILGEDLYIVSDGKYKGTSYSPDGIAIMSIPKESMSMPNLQFSDDMHEQIIIPHTKPIPVLIEFKCPYSRIPSGKVPKYYLPQVKMGLELLNFPELGLFIEGVFRRCSWEQLGDNPDYDKTLVSKSSGKLPLAYGICGFYLNKVKFTEHLSKIHNNKKISELKKLLDKFLLLYKSEYTYGNNTNNYHSNDLGDMSPEIFTILMEAYDKKILTPWYGKIVATAPPKFADVNTVPYDEHAAKVIMDQDLAEYTQFCSEWDLINFGILPWKLFRLDYNYVTKTEDYLLPWMPKITEVIDIVKKCLDPANAERKNEIYYEYINKNSSSNEFSDNF
jgi:hypothetical protein